MSRNLIDDGHTRKGYLDGDKDPGFFENFKFTYRPMLPGQVARLDNEIDACSDGSHADIIAGVIAKQLETWSEVKANGQPVPIKPQTVKRLPYILFSHLHQIIKGVRLSDEEPYVDAENSEDADRKADTICHGTEPVSLTEADAKN